MSANSMATPRITYVLILENPRSNMLQVKMALNLPLVSGTDTEVDRYLRFGFASGTGVGACEQSATLAWRKITFAAAGGAPLYFFQSDVGQWTVDLQREGFVWQGPQLYVDYEVHGLGDGFVSTLISEDKVFLRGRDIFLQMSGISERENWPAQVRCTLTPLFSHIVSTLEDISPTREQFVFQASGGQQLQTSCFLLTCQESSGMRLELPEKNIKKEVYFAYTGQFFPPEQMWRKDLQNLMTKIWKGGPFFNAQRFLLQFDFNGTQLKSWPEGSLGEDSYFALTALGASLHIPKNYSMWLRSVIVAMHNWQLLPLWKKLPWAQQGLLHFLSWQSLGEFMPSLQGEEEILRLINFDFDLFYHSPERGALTLEQSTWEVTQKTSPLLPLHNSHSHLFFILLMGFLREQRQQIYTFLQELLWDPRPLFVLLAEKLPASDVEILENFYYTTIELPWSKLWGRLGLTLEMQQGKGGETESWGLELLWRQGHLLVLSVEMGGAAQSAGLMAGDEILAINGLRMHRGNYREVLGKLQSFSHSCPWLLSRRNIVLTVDVGPVAPSALPPMRLHFSPVGKHIFCELFIRNSY